MEKALPSGSSYRQTKADEAGGKSRYEPPGLITSSSMMTTLCANPLQPIRSTGLKVEILSSAHAFLRSARWTSLVVDVRLPGLSGLDLSKRAGR
jgi:hypothetical protein